MATGQLSLFLRRLHRVTLAHAEDVSDAHLLECFIARRDEAAFEALVRRHGPMVLGVCRRVLRGEADAEDAFQATFLVLVRKATSVRPRRMVGNWLYGVARRTAMKARTTIIRRRVKERQAASHVSRERRVEEGGDDLQSLLDQELARLPDKYRAPLLLCDLEGKTRKDAASQLGWPEGTVATRLVKARTLLAKKLARRGLALSGGVAVLALARDAAAFVPTSLTASAVKAASLFAMGSAATAGVTSAKVVALTKGVLKSMLLQKLTTVSVAMTLTASLVCTGLWANGRTLQVRAAEGEAIDAPARVTDAPEDKRRVQRESPPKDGPKNGSERKMFPRGLDHDFGDRPHGIVLKHRFAIVNTGKAALTIVSLRLSCGCAKITASQKVLQPNEKGELIVSLDTGRFVGPKTVRISVGTASGGVQQEFPASVRANSVTEP